MDFSWIKKIFTKKSSKNESVGITKIDTSFTYVRRYSKLKRNEKKIVKELLNKTDFNNYKELVKFSDDLASLYSFEQDILSHTIKRYDDETYYIDKCYDNPTNAMIKKVNFAKMAICEYSTIVDNIKKIRNELEYRFNTIDLFIKKWETPGIFKKNSIKEQNEFLRNKNSLYEERQRILNSIRNIDNVLGMIAICIKEDTKLDKNYHVLEQFNMIINNKEFSSKLKEELSAEIYDNNWSRFEPINISKSFEKEIIEKMYTIIYEYYRNKPIVLDKLNTATNESEILYTLIKYIPNNKLDEVYKIFAKYLHQYEIYLCTHKNDYKDYLKEIDTVINEYKNTATKNWDTVRLRYLIIYYSDWSNKYFDLYDELNMDIVNEITNKINYLYWMYNLKEKRYIGEFKISNEIDYAINLLDEVEKKFNVKLDKSNYLSQEARRNGFIKKYVNTGFMKKNFINLFDLLNGNEEDVKINFYWEIDLKKNNVFYTQVKMPYEESSSRLIVYPEAYPFIFHSRNISKIDDSEGKYSIDKKRMTDWDIFVTNIQNHVLERQLDYRLLYIPAQYYKYSDWLSDMLNNDNQIEAVYLEDTSILYNYLMDVPYKKHASKLIFIKYKNIPFIYDYGVLVEDYRNLIMGDDHFKLTSSENGIHKYEYIKYNYECATIIVVPNDTKYSDLIDLMEQEKEKNKQYKKELG